MCGRFLLIACLWALGCGSGASVTLTTEGVAAHPLPGTLAAVMTQVQRPLETCYRDALKVDGKLTGTVRAVASGSHGVIKVDIAEPAPPALAECMRGTLTGQRLARELVDGDVIVGVAIIATFG